MTADEPDYLGHRKRLKERFFADLGKSMLDYELLELYLTGYIPRKDVKPIAKRLIKRFGSLNGVLHAKVEELMKEDGIGCSTAENIAISRACWHRADCQQLQNEEAVILSSWDAVIDYLRSTIGYLDVEEFHALYFDVHQRLIKDETLQRGTVNTVNIYPREVIRLALEYKSMQLILTHNHPSGDVTPSQADIQLTRQIKDGLSAVDVTLVDHIIVGQNLYFSFKDHNLLH